MIEQFKWKGKIIFPTRSAQDEMFKENIDLYKAIKILENGFDCSRSKRANNVYERCITGGKKVTKVVAADTGDNIIIIHVGSFTASKNMRRMKNGKV